MQSMFRLPWSSEAPGDRIMEKSAFHKPRSVPVVELTPFLHKLKRRAPDSPDSASPKSAHVVKKWKNAHGEVKPVSVDGVKPERPLQPDGLPQAVHVKPQLPPTPTTASISPPTLSTPAPAPVAASPPSEAAIPLEPSVSASVPVQPSRDEQSSLSVQDGAASQKKASPDMRNRRDELVMTIEAQFSHEILLKHNELRLIEQELAKCQVALEQLRRCQIIPYPGATGFSEDVSRGVGPALRPKPGYTKPEYATPYGVMDGPYTRHYARWLIQDPRFDSVPDVPAASPYGYGPYMEGRTTRGSFAEHSGFKPRTSRTSNGLKLHALGESVAPAPKPDPLLHKRSTDGQWVRLYCAACKHSNFSNTQGFLNHCRIKHNQVFKSHDAAAIACGVPVDPNEVGPTAPPAEPAATPAVQTPVSAGATLVHPLIKADPSTLAKRLPPRQITIPATKPRAGGFQTPVTSTPGVAGTPSDYFASPRTGGFAQTPGRQQTPFVPSPQTPYMSQLLQQRGFPGNLQKLVETARTKVDVESVEVSSDDEQESAGRRTGNKGARTSNAPLSRLPARPTSKKSGNLDSARITPLDATAVSQRGSQRGAIAVSPVELSPNTIESNPGLVSDHEDDDDDDDARSVPHLDREGDHFMDDAVVVEDGSDGEARKRVRGFVDSSCSSRK